MVQVAKRMNVAKGTARLRRRAAAKMMASEHGISHKYFKHFWHLGATAEAAEAVVKMQLDSADRVLRT